jgi:hypothetical protein
MDHIKSILKMKAVFAFETSEAVYSTARPHGPEERRVRM